MKNIELEKENEFTWRIKKTGKMRTDGIIYANDTLIEKIKQDNSPLQVANVATLPGIIGYSMAMPDIHWGYGFPIGGVAAFDSSGGIVSPGGVGYDINCGVRMMTTNLTYETIKPHLNEIVQLLFRAVPCGVGSRNKEIRISEPQLNRVLNEGAAVAVAFGYGTEEDLLYLESKGTIPDADASAVSSKAKDRGRAQLGTLGSGNHFLEIDLVTEIFSKQHTSDFELEENQIVITIHTGSRGLGHQVCDDAVRDMQRASSKYNISLPDRQLACAPIGTKEAEKYLGAMASAANFAFANRQIISHLVRRTLHKFFSDKGIQYHDKILYDVAHNIAKWEEHAFGGTRKKLLVHRKGATRAFGPGHPEIPQRYKKTGQPVLIPGDMGTASYVLAGTEGAMKNTFGSTCHGAGRVMSRHEAKKFARSSSAVTKLKRLGIIVKAASKGTIAEEIPEAYKDVSEVVKVVDMAGIAKIVAKLTPLAVIKG